MDKLGLDHATLGSIIRILVICKISFSRTYFVESIVYCDCRTAANGEKVVSNAYPTQNGGESYQVEHKTKPEGKEP